ncbi:polysaccharide deacetylase family protein [Christensenellaceae bacterium OttesenSCG-928-M15]|nr:polysaccharide deacetylase family protein [Christensenellaceae bacterium OttesenSCG-928-M15]
MKWFSKRARALINAALAVMMVALYIAITTPAAKSAISELYNSPIYRGHKKGHVAVACAVSWNASAIMDMLDTLKENDVTVTFLLSGEYAKENGETVRRMVEDGHEIGTMGNDPHRDGDAAYISEDVSDAARIIQMASGVKPALYYSGVRDVKTSSRAASRLEMTHILCTVDVLSARGTAQDILSRALDKPFDGSIILMEPTKEAAKALPACLNGLKGYGFEVTTVGNVLG